MALVTITCDDCCGVIKGVFKSDEDGRYFHIHCGGAEFAKRMSTMRGSPEYLRQLESSLAFTSGVADKLTEALEQITLHGQHSGVIPCPQDHQFYVEPMQKIARAALAAYEEKKKP